MSACICSTNASALDEGLLSPESLQELHADALAVQRPREVQQEGLDTHHAVGFERRVGAHAGDRGRSLFPVGARARDVHAQRRRGQLAFHRQVGGRHTQAAAAARAADHRALQRRRPTQQPSRQGDVAGPQRLADAGARDGTALALEQTHGRDREPVVQSEGQQIARRPGPLVAEVEVIAHHDLARAQAGREQARAELLGRHARECGREGNGHDLANTQSPEHVHLLLERRQQPGRLAGSQHGVRVRLERQHRGDAVHLRGGSDRLADDLLVTPVHPVERPDGDGARPAPQVGDLVDGTVEAHASLLRGREHHQRPRTAVRTIIDARKPASPRTRNRPSGASRSSLPLTTRRATTSSTTHTGRNARARSRVRAARPPARITSGESSSIVSASWTSNRPMRDRRSSCAYPPTPSEAPRSSARVRM